MEPAVPVSYYSKSNGNHKYDDIIDWFENACENAGHVQTQTLRQILQLNYGVEYLKKWFGEQRDNLNIQNMDACALESLFTSTVPLASHADLDPYIQRIADGDKAPLLTQQPITTLSLSSGTTDGRQKYVPFTGHSAQTTLQIFRLAAAYRSRVYPIREGGRILELIYSSKQFKTKGGLTTGTATTHYFASQEFKIKQEKTKSFTCSPEEVISSGDYKQSNYCHLLLGSMQHYLKKLRHYAGELPLVSADYGSTESWIGVNVDPYLPPEKVTFAVVPTFSYYEFIPLYRQKEDYHSAIDDFIEDKPVPLSHVKLGQQYEIVLTTFTGLYRYRLGDVVEVAGFHKGTPKLNFVCRRKLILTVNIDKNTEKDLQLVVERGSQLLSQARVELVDFTSHADIANQPGHYIIYWEIKGEVEEQVLSECCREMDASFVDHGYVVSRKTNSIGPLELCIVETGTFTKILDYFIGNGAAMSQFKTPRCTSNQVILRILNVCTIKRVYSTAYG
ncbi:hypothetical protein ACB098_06G107100 [Castanea mollissima]